jgi:hypothetical protein
MFSKKPQKRVGDGKFVANTDAVKVTKMATLQHQLEQAGHVRPKR